MTWSRRKLALYGSLFALAGVTSLALSSAATNLAHHEAESGTLAGCAARQDHPAAAGVSGNAAVRFNGGCGTPSGGTAGASLPITYDLASLPGALRYVAPDGSDTAGNGSAGAPFASIAKAISVAASNDSIVLRGGTYRNQAGLMIAANKTLNIVAYPGEIPVLNGARPVTGGWAAEGSLRYIAYTPRPVTDGVMSFTTNQGVAGDGVGKYADQAWRGDTELRQVSQKTALTDGRFWVDRTNNRLYLTATDAGQGGIEVTQNGRLAYTFSPDTRFEGLRVMRYSDTGGEYGLFLFGPDADNTLVRNVEVIENAYAAFFYAGDANPNEGSRLERVTILRSNWMGVLLNGTNNFSLLDSRISGMNKWDEFLADPSTGAIKTARTWDTKVIGNQISDNHGHGVWFDISNYRTVVANNSITGTTHVGLFYEISDDLLLINNYIAGSGASQPVRLAGSSGLKLVNNTIIGGQDAIGLYTDERSKTGCSNPANPPCGEWGGYRDSFHPHLATMDWMPRLDLMVNNIVAYPTKAGFCGVLTPMCVTQRNNTAYVPLEWTIHKADATTGRPQTTINGNVYANGTGPLIAINEPQGRYTTPAAFAAAMAGPPVGIAGFESAGLYGNAYVNADGSPTQALADKHGQAAAVPTDAAINQYVPAGTRHYGVTYK